MGYLYPAVTVIHLPEYRQVVTAIPVEVFGELIKLPNGRIVVPARIVFKIMAIGGSHAPQGFILGEIDPMNEPNMTPQEAYDRAVAIGSEYYRHWMWN